MADQPQSIDVKERVRKSLDKIRINNPFDYDLTVVWDGFFHVIRAKSFAIVERYLADKYLMEQCKRIITERTDKLMKEEDARRKSNNQLPMDRTMLTGEKLAFESEHYLGWTSRFKDIIKEYGLYGGIAEEYGMQYVPQEAPKNAPMHSSLIDEMEEADNEPRMATNQPVSVPNERSLVDELENKDVFTLKKIAKERGIVTEKTVKKDELIRLLTQE